MKRVCLVSGASKGIGRAIVLELASKGYDVVINYNNSEELAKELENEVSKYNVNCLAIKADISNVNEVKNMIDLIREKMGSVDILINNAATYNDCFFKDKTSNDFKKVLDVNLVGAFNLIKEVSKDMLDKKWGRIINISSTNGINTYYPMCLEYDASKAGLISLTHNIAIELAPYVTCNAICPGFIATESELKDMDEEFIKSEIEKIYVKRIGEPKDIAKLVGFLVSDDASYINSSVIRIDGGMYGS